MAAQLGPVEIPQMQFLDKFVLPVVMHGRCLSSLDGLVLCGRGCAC